jgi:hypothetical protein
MHGTFIRSRRTVSYINPGDSLDLLFGEHFTAIAMTHMTMSLMSNHGFLLMEIPERLSSSLIIPGPVEFFPQVYGGFT